MSSDPKITSVSEKRTEDVLDESGITIAIVKLAFDGRISVQWMAELFTQKGAPMTPTIRGAVARQLRFHADAVESGELDRQMCAMLKAQG